MISFFIAVTTIITLFSNPIIASAKTENKITGIVALKDLAGEAPLNGLEILLYSHGNKQSNVIRSKTDKDGKFEFDNLITGELSYYITTKYEGISYGSNVVRFSGGDDRSKHIKLVVYSTFTDRKIIEVSEHFIVIDIDTHNKKFLVEETMTLANNSTNIYIGERELSHNIKEILRIKLPGKYNELEYLEGLNVNSSFESESGILDTSPLKPGNKKIAFKYQIPFNSPKQELVWVTYFQTRKLKISIKNIGLNIYSSSLLFDDIYFINPKDKDGETGAYFKDMIGLDLPPNTFFSLEISNFPKKEKDIRLIIAFLFIGLLFVVCMRIRKNI